MSWRVFAKSFLLAPQSKKIPVRHEVYLQQEIAGSVKNDRNIFPWWKNSIGF
jgi:hypothetical protein